MINFGIWAADGRLVHTVEAELVQINESNNSYEFIANGKVVGVFFPMPGFFIA